VAAQAPYPFGVIRQGRVALSPFSPYKYQSGENEGEGDFGEKILDEGRLFNNQRRQKKIDRHYKEKNTTKERRDYRRGEKQGRRGIGITLLGSFRGEKQKEKKEETERRE
jgi:hypothetical protein